MGARAFFGAAALAASVVVACGGASDTGLFGAGGDDGGATGDGGAKDAASDAAKQDAGTNVVACQGTPGCKVGAQACCRKNNAFSCVTLGECNGGLEIPCDKQRDCGSGNVCCLLADDQGIAKQIACRTAADCAAQQRSAQLCDPNAPNVCPPMLTCQPSTEAIPGYNICR